MYIYFGALAVAYAFLAFMRSGAFTDASVGAQASDLFLYLPALVGGFLFSAIYTDDLHSKNLITLVGFGISKTQIIISKFLLMVCFSGIIYAIFPLFHIGLYGALGSTATGTVTGMIYILALKYFLVTVGFAALTGIVVYGTQRTTFSMVLYILLAFNIVSALLATLINQIKPELTRYMMDGITNNIMIGVMDGQVPILYFVQFFIYVGIAVALSVLAFHKKEMEF
jgi:ABC-type transport system involved in multi-copper enzyme maturation permease subunit